MGLGLTVIGIFTCAFLEPVNLCAKSVSNLRTKILDTLDLG